MLLFCVLNLIRGSVLWSLLLLTGDVCFVDDISSAFSGERWRYLCLDAESTFGYFDTTSILHIEEMTNCRVRMIAAHLHWPWTALFACLSICPAFLWSPGLPSPQLGFCLSCYRVWSGLRTFSHLPHAFATWPKHPCMLCKCDPV